MAFAEYHLLVHALRLPHPVLLPVNGNAQVPLPASPMLRDPLSASAKKSARQNSFRLLKRSLLPVGSTNLSASITMLFLSEDATGGRLEAESRGYGTTTTGSRAP